MNNFEDISIVRVRDFWNSRPCNIRHSPKPVGEREYFDEVEARKYFVEPHIPRFAEFPRWANKRVLEVGCGIGTDTINFARAGAEVTAVDLSERSLEIAQKRAQIYGLNNITFVQSNVEDLARSISTSLFDLVYSFGVIHHTPHPERALSQVSAVLGPGGTLKLMVYHRYSWKVFSIVTTYGHGAFWDLDRVIAQHSEAQAGCPVTYTYSERQFRTMIEGVGCRIEDIFVDHIFPWRVRDYIEYRYKRVWYFAALPAAVFRRLERHFGWHLCVTAVKA
jgi:2-polyprenyl-3-methyl-5-hydroxy-6-metoxy-1,4-benzoquinol methylase